MFAARIRAFVNAIAGTALVGAAIGLAVFGAAGSASAEHGCVTYARFSTCWGD